VALVPVGAPPLPRRAREHARRLVFAERLEPAGLAAEDLDTARLIARIQAGDRDAFAVLYMRYFDRIYTYLRAILRDADQAEDAAQQVFIRVIEALPGYQIIESKPFRAWIFTIARNLALTHLKRESRLEPLPDGDELPGTTHQTSGFGDQQVLGWISDRELMLFVERLPLAQRQVLFLRYVAGLRTSDVAEILGQTPVLVRKHHERALRFLRQRLVALGRVPETRRDPIRSRLIFRQAAIVRKRRFSLISPG
jgi:RNA polymerase sigma-70 factor (ECF subfamily)